MDRRRRANPKCLAEKLLVIRLRLGVTQSQLARLLGFDKPARVAEYERGVRQPELIVLLNYAKLGQIPMYVLANDDLELKFPKRWKNHETRGAVLQQRVNETDEQFWET